LVGGLPATPHRLTSLLIGKLDHRANAITIALLLANVTLLAATPKGVESRRRQSDPPVGSAYGADLGRTQAPIPPYNPGTPLD
jgi:hypothetical protein